jgi:hypothetical protein
LATSPAGVFVLHYNQQLEPPSICTIIFNIAFGLINKDFPSPSIPQSSFHVFYYLFSFLIDFLYNEWKEVISGKGSR